MKIVMINTLYPPLAVGGAERVVSALAKGLVLQGDSVVVITLTMEHQSKREFIDGVTVIRLPLHNIYWPFGAKESPLRRVVWHAIDSFNVVAAKAIASILIDERPDIVHTHNLAGFSSRVWRVIKDQGLPLVHSLHDYYLLCPRSTMFRNSENCDVQCFGCKCLSKVRCSQAAFVDCVVGVSQFVLERHVKTGIFASGAEKEVVHNSLTHELKSEEMTVARNPSLNGSLRIGFLGRIEREKGIEVLLQAVVRLPEGQWELLVAGEGDEVYIAKLKCTYPMAAIKFIGHKQLPEFFSAVDLLVVPSVWHEPLGMVAFEAMFFGVPVVAARRGGLSEIVLPGVGVLFDPDEPDSLVRVLDTLRSDRKTLLDMSNQALVHSQKFNADLMINKYRDIYCRLLSSAV